MAMWWHTLVASLGGVVCLLQNGSPMRAVLQAREEHVLGELNPLPFALMAANAAGWVAYSYVVGDPLVLWPNMVGLLLGLFYTLTCYGLADGKMRDRLTALMLCVATYIMVVGAAGTLGGLPHDKLKNLWGFAANAILLAFYASPLTTMLEVLRTRCSASLHLPLSAMNLLSSTLWLAYGLGLGDLFIAVPNGVGAALALLCCTLLFVFPSTSSGQPATVGTQATTGSDVETGSTIKASSSADDGEAVPAVCEIQLGAPEVEETPTSGSIQAGPFVADVV